MADTIQNAIKWDHPAAAHAVIVDADNGVMDWKGRTKFGLVGFASSSRDSAPWDDPSWILMGLNQLYRHCPRFDAWIDIHHYWADPASMVEGTDEVACWMASNTTASRRSGVQRESCPHDHRQLRGWRRRQHRH